jgi:hypothetical protein
LVAVALRDMNSAMDRILPAITPAADIALRRRRNLRLRSVQAKASDVGVLAVVRVAYRLAKTRIEFIAVQDDFLRMDGSNGAERNGEIAGVLDVDDELVPPVRRDPADGGERFVIVGDEHLKAF